MYRDDDTGPDDETGFRDGRRAGYYSHIQRLFTDDLYWTVDRANEQWAEHAFYWDSYGSSDRFDTCFW